MTILSAAAHHSVFWIIVYCTGFVWFYLGYAKLQWKRALFPSNGYVNIVCNTAISAIVFILPVLISISEQPRISLHPLFSLTAGIPLIGASLFLQILARRRIGVFPGGPFNGLRRERGLVTTGIYQHMRHPIYFGFILWQGGLAILFGGVFALLFSLFYFLALLPLILLEERELRGRYGEVFTTYKNRTPMLVPDFSKLKKRT